MCGLCVHQSTILLLFLYKFFSLPDACKYSHFSECLHIIYPSELDIKDTTASRIYNSYLDLFFDIVTDLNSKTNVMVLAFQLSIHPDSSSTILGITFILFPNELLLTRNKSCVCLSVSLLPFGSWQFGLGSDLSWCLAFNGTLFYLVLFYSFIFPMILASFKSPQAIHMIPLLSWTCWCVFENAIECPLNLNVGGMILHAGCLSLLFWLIVYLFLFILAHI